MQESRTSAAFSLDWSSVQTAALQVCVCTIICTHVSTHLCSHTRVRIYAHVYTDVYTQVCTHTYTQAYAHVYTNVCTYVHAHVHSHVCSHVDTSVHINLGVPVTEKTGRLGKWPGALGQLINMIKWTMGDVRSAFGARESALFALGCSLKAKSCTKRTPRSAVNSPGRSLPGFLL